MLFFTNCRIRLCVPHNLSLDLFEMKSPLASDTRSSYTHSLETHINPADIGQHTGTRNAKHKSLTQLSLTHTHRYEAPPFPFLALPPLLLFLEGGVCVLSPSSCVPYLTQFFYPPRSPDRYFYARKLSKRPMTPIIQATGKRSLQFLRVCSRRGRKFKGHNVDDDNETQETKKKNKKTRRAEERTTRTELTTGGKKRGSTDDTEK